MGIWAAGSSWRPSGGNAHQLKAISCLRSHRARLWSGICSYASPWEAAGPPDPGSAGPPGPQPAKAVREPAGRPGPRERRAAPFARDVPARPDRHLPPDAGTLTIRPPGRVAAPSQHTRPGAAAQRRRDAQKPGPRPRQAGAGLRSQRPDGKRRGPTAATPPFSLLDILVRSSRDTGVLRTHDHRQKW